MIRLTVVFIVLLAGARFAKASDPYSVNLDHLLSLVQRVELNGQEVAVVDVYADYPDYKPVAAEGEGFACVDDAARAAILLMRYNEVFRTHENTSVIDGLLNFIIGMQRSDGCFYNFVKNVNGRIEINKEGRTSVASFDWWSVRALWSLGVAAEYYRHSDPARYQKVVGVFNRSMPLLDSLLMNYGKLSASGAPTWLINGSGADAASEMVLGLNAMYRATGEKSYMSAAGKLCDGMVLLQKGNCEEAPYGMLASNGWEWHGWASSQSDAIMEYSRLSNDSLLSGRALEEVNCFLPRWAGAHFFRGCNLKGDSLDYSGQIAYAVRPAVSAAAEAYEITHEKKYKTLACILASWFFGNNTAGVEFYHEQTGVCFDGTTDSVGVNKNSGAESTVEALLTMVELHRIGAEFHGIRLESRPSFNANNYRYRFDGGELVVRATPDGFKLETSSSPR